MVDTIVYTLATTTTNTPQWISDLDFTQFTTMAGDIAAKVGPVVVAIGAVVLGIKLVKKFMNKIG